MLQKDEVKEDRETAGRRTMKTKQIPIDSIPLRGQVFNIIDYIPRDEICYYNVHERFEFDVYKVGESRYKGFVAYVYERYCTQWAELTNRPHFLPKPR